MILIQKEKPIQPDSNFAGYDNELKWRLQGDLENKEISISIGYDLSLGHVRQHLEKLVRVKSLYFSIEMKHYDTDMLYQILMAFAQLTQLQEIRLPETKNLEIASIFNILRQLPQLSTIRSAAPLTNWLEQLPTNADLPFAKNATILEISHSADLKNLIYFPNLTHLTIQHAPLKTIDNAIGTLRHLQFLKIDHSDRLETLPNVFDKLQQLETVECSYLSAFKKLPNSFYKSKSINILHFKENSGGLNLRFCWIAPK